LAALTDALQTVRQGAPAAVLLGGDAGMGKTRLIAEFTATARAAGARTLSGACLELGADGLPFSPFTAMLRDLVRAEGSDEVACLLPGNGRATRELARLLPELMAELPAQEMRTASIAAGEARARLFEEFLSLLERLAEHRPLVLVVEDAHWADRSSRDLLAFLIGYQRALRNVLIVATFRSDELHRTHPLRPLLAELARIDWVERIDLPPLTRGQAEELAAALLGRAADQALAEAIYQRAEGNPLFTEELLACSSLGDMVPDTLSDLLLQKVRRLPEDTQEILRIASAASGVTSHALLARVTGRAADELATAIRPAVASNVLVTCGDGYSFRHALIQEAVHEDLLPGEHASVHGKFARAIDAEPALVPRGRADIERAHHWYAAHDTTWALVGSWRAVAQHSNTFGHAERLVLLDRVLELWDQVPDAAERIGADHVGVLESAAEAAWDAGEHRRGLAFTELALAELDETAEPVRVALLLRQRHTFRKELGLGNTMADLNRALALVPEKVSRRARTQLLLAAAHCGNDYEHPRRDWVREALRLAREDGDRDAEAQGLADLALMEAGHGQAAAADSEPLRMIARALTITQRTEAYHPILKLVIYESHLLCGAGDFERAALVAERGIADAERHGLARTGGAFLSMNRADPLYYLGRWDEAVKVTERALDLAPPVRTRAGLWILHGNIALARGDLATAARRVAASRATLSEGSFDEQYYLPLAELDIGVTCAAEGPAAAVTLAAETIQRYDLASASPRYAWPVLVAAAAAARQAPGDDAAQLLDRLRTLAEKLDSYGPVQLAWRDSFAALDSRSDDRGGRLAAADAAVAAWETAGQPYSVAVALVYAARVALATGARYAAAARLKRAAPIAERLGATPLAGQIASLTQQAGDSPGGSEPGLTHRELEVLRLVAAGRSNREIAAALVISPKTASVHVSNILAKLGAATRTEAAVKAQQLLLLDLPG
jgi:DNA-binding CsgD family transcriptional regulator